MNSLRRWLYRPKRSDQSLLAQFYFADEELNHVAAELDSFEGKGYPEKCAVLVNQLRACQARVLNVVSQMMDESIKDQRALRDFRVKFPDDLCQENLAGQLWFGAECLAAGSSIMNKEVESACMRPLARALTKNLDSLRTILREQCLQNVNEYTEMITESLIIFDKLFAEFELSYVSAMAPVKTAHEYDMIQEITVLFSETVERALRIGLLSQDMIDEYDPALMFTIPRLAIVCGTLIFKDGPLNPDNDPRNISEMFRPFQTLLHKIRELLSILTSDELNTLERALCSQDEPSFLVSLEEKRKQAREERRRNRKGKKSVVKAEKRIETQEEDNGSIESELTAREIAERLEALALNFEASRNSAEPSANRGAEGNTPVDIRYQNGEVYSSSSSPLSCSAADGVCHGQTAAQDLLAQQRDDQQLPNVDKPHQEDLNGEMSAPFENSHRTISSSLLTECNGHTQNVSETTCENSNVLNNRDMEDEDDDDGINLKKNSGTNSSELGRYELNKCNSNDSGLHSDILSNSGSMFTISSSDSNQQITTSESVLPLTDQNGIGCEEDSAEKKQECELPERDISEFSTPSPQRSLQDNSNISGPDEIDSCHTDSASCNLHKNEPRVECSDFSEAKTISNDSNAIGGSSSTTLETSEEDQKTSLVEAYETRLQQQNSDILKIDTDSENSSAVNSESKEEQTSENQPESEHSQVLEEEPDLTKSHACALQSDSEINCKSNHSSNDSSTPKDACDNNLLEIDLLKNCAKTCINEGNESLVCEASDTYLKDISDFATSESDSNSDTQSSFLNVVSNLQLDGTDQLQNPASILSAPALPQASDEFDHENSDIVPHLSVASSNSNATANNHAVNTSSTQTQKVNSEVTKISEHAESVTSQQMLLQASSSQTQTKHSSKKSHHRGHKELRRGNRSDVHSRLSKDKKPKLCAAHSKMMLHASQLDSDCYNSSETSSYTSDCGDQEEIALAIEAAESASRNNVRARFKSNSDMIHRLFVCISGVADQLQTNFAGDLRNILRSVFDMNCSEPVDKGDGDKPKDLTSISAAYRAMSQAARASRHRHSSLQRQDPPIWLPDKDCNECMACQVPFSFVRRRHHCRNCGKIFCRRCSSNYVRLPQFGQDKAVRVCNRCFMFQVTPFH